MKSGAAIGGAGVEGIELKVLARARGRNRFGRIRDLGRRGTAVMSTTRKRDRKVRGKFLSRRAELVHHMAQEALNIRSTLFLDRHTVKFLEDKVAVDVFSDIDTQAFNLDGLLVDG